MKLEEDTEIPRLDDVEPSELGRLVRAARNRRPSAAAAARMAERLAPASAAAALESSNHAGRLGLGSTKIGALALVALGGALFASQARTSEHHASPESPSATHAVPATPVAPSAATTVAVPTMAVEALPSSMTTPEVASAPARVAPARPAPSPEKPSPRTREDEFALIQRAQDQLASSPARALSILDDHARAFPSGELTQERETMRVEALVRVDRNAEARTCANALLARFPRTPYVARLERALGEPLSAASSSNTAR